MVSSSAPFTLVASAGWHHPSCTHSSTVNSRRIMAKEAVSIIKPGTLHISDTLVVISSMMTFGFCSQIWVPLFTFPTVQAPRFPNGYPAVVVFEVAMWSILMFGVWYMARWKLKNPDVESITATPTDQSSSQGEVYDEKDSPSGSVPSTPIETQAVLALVSSREGRR